MSEFLKRMEGFIDESIDSMSPEQLAEFSRKRKQIQFKNACFDLWKRLCQKKTDMKLLHHAEMEKIDEEIRIVERIQASYPAEPKEGQQ